MKMISKISRKLIIVMMMMIKFIIFFKIKKCKNKINKILKTNQILNLNTK